MVRRQDQAQIYQELVTAPPEKDPRCGIGAPAVPPFTTSFLSICGRAKDNRILPSGFLPLADRTRIALAIGAEEDLAQDVEPHGVGDDPDYREGGGDSLIYEVDLVGGRRHPRRRPGDALLPGHAALLPPGPLLHVEERGHAAALLPGRPPQPGRHRGGGLEARGGEHRAGEGPHAILRPGGFAWSLSSSSPTTLPRSS